MICNRAIMFIFAGAACLAEGACFAHNDKPSRAECIAGVELLWPNQSGDRIHVLNKIPDQSPLIKQYPAAGLSVQGSERIYTIFDRDCSMKDVMMDQIMQRYRESIPEFPEYKLLEKRIELSANTIQVYGEYWSDGKVPSEVKFHSDK